MALLVLLPLALAAWMYRTATADPVVRWTSVAMPGLDSPVRLLLISDIHVGGPDMPPSRLARIVARINALRPDLVLIAGDFVAGHDPLKGRAYADRLAGPLAGLHAPLGVVAVLGNHDHWTAPDRIAGVLRGAGETVLTNAAVRRGPLVVVGVDDEFSGHADVGRALRAAEGLEGARVVLTHTPDTTRIMPAAGGALLLAGHTHCGQAVLPLVGSLAVHRFGSALYRPRHECGAVRDPSRLVIVTGGIGASLPFRYGAPPDLWLLTLGP